MRNGVQMLIRFSVAFRDSNDKDWCNGTQWSKCMYENKIHVYKSLWFFITMGINWIRLCTRVIRKTTYLKTGIFGSLLLVTFVNDNTMKPLFMIYTYEVDRKHEIIRYDDKMPRDIWLLSCSFFHMYAVVFRHSIIHISYSNAWMQIVLSDNLLFYLNNWFP